MIASRGEEMWQTRAACRGPHAVVFFPPSRPERKDERIAGADRQRDLSHVPGNAELPRLRHQDPGSEWNLGRPERGRAQTAGRTRYGRPTRCSLRLSPFSP